MNKIKLVFLLGIIFFVVKNIKTGDIEIVNKYKEAIKVAYVEFSSPTSRESVVLEPGKSLILKDLDPKKEGVWVLPKSKRGYFRVFYAKDINIQDDKNYTITVQDFTFHMFTRPNVQYDIVEKQVPVMQENETKKVKEAPVEILRESLVRDDLSKSKKIEAVKEMLGDMDPKLADFSKIDRDYCKGKSYVINKKEKNVQKPKSYKEALVKNEYDYCAVPVEHLIVNKIRPNGSKYSYRYGTQALKEAIRMVYIRLALEDDNESERGFLEYLVKDLKSAVYRINWREMLEEKH